MLTIPLTHRFPNARRRDASDHASFFDALDLLDRRGAPLIHIDGPHVRERLAAWFENHRAIEAWRSRIVHVTVREQDTDAHALCAMLNDLFVAMRGVEKVEQHVSLDEALMHVIDFADTHRLDVVVGRAEWLSAPARAMLSTTLVAHVHAARWFWLWEDARAVGVEGEVLSGASPAPEEARQDAAAEDLDEQAWQLLSVLSRQDYTIIERDALTALGLSAQTSKRLRERGLVEVLPSGLCLTERGAEVQAHHHGSKLGRRDAATIRAFVQGLRHIEDERDEVARLFDAFTCAISHRIFDEVEAILTEYFEAFRRADLLMDVYVRLLDANEPRLRAWLFRASCYMSDFDRAESLRWREELELEDAMYWIYLLLNRGRHDQLQEMATALLARHEREGMNRETRMCCEQIRLLQARAFIQSTKHAQALETIAPVLDTDDLWMRINARFVQIRALAYAGEIARGRALLPALMEEVEGLTLAEQRKWAIFTIQSCYVLKMYGESARVARRCFGDGASLNHLKSTAPILLAALWAEVGDAELARRAIDFARSAFRESAVMLGMIVNIDLADAIARGDLARVRGCLEEFASLQSQQISEVSRIEHHALDHMAWILFGPRLRDLDPPARAPSHDEGAFTRCMDTLWQLRHGAIERDGRLEEEAACVASQGDEESYLFDVLQRAWVGAVRGVCVVDEVERAVLIAKKCAMCRIGQELAQLYCIQSYLFCPARLDKAVGNLAELATRSGSERFLQEVRWWRLVQDRHTLRIHDLEVLADELTASSLGHQIAARLLGLLEEGEIGPLEELLTRTMGEQLFEERVCNASRTPRLVLHLDAGEAWRPGARGERVLELDRTQVGFALLRCLAGAGQMQEVEKEALIKQVWQDVEEYHPLRHNNRLRVAIRKLRKELREVLGEDEEWIQTTTAGYAMGCEVRLVTGK